MRKRPLRERFEEKLNKNGPIMPNMTTPCHEWTGFRNDDGYGTIRIGRKMELAHRTAWLLEKGELPKTPIAILHRCDNPPCARYDHLFSGTRAENNADRDQKGRQKTARGSDHRLAKLTEESVRSIRERVANRTALQKDLAVEYGVSENLISMVVNRKIWAHV